MHFGGYKCSMRTLHRFYFMRDSTKLLMIGFSYNWSGLQTVLHSATSLLAAVRKSDGLQHKSQPYIPFRTVLVFR